MSTAVIPEPDEPARARPFRRAVLRGVGVLLPPLLTIVIFVWVGRTIAVYMLAPLERAAEHIIYTVVADIREAQPNVDPRDGSALIGDRVYVMMADGKFVPQVVWDFVRNNSGDEPLPNTASGVYHRYVRERYLQRHVVIPVFVCLLLLTLYFFGKFLAAGFGRFFWTILERIISRVPLVRNVYSSVKQVTDFMFGESQVSFTRVVAVEYPRKGAWAVAFVMGESMLDLQTAMNEPVVALMIPSSPMPFTGFTVTVRKSETIDLDISLDQALQFLVSCGVVVPPHQMARLLQPQAAGLK